MILAGGLATSEVDISNVTTGCGTVLGQFWDPDSLGVLGCPLVHRCFTGGTRPAALRRWPSSCGWPKVLAPGGQRSRLTLAEPSGFWGWII